MDDCIEIWNNESEEAFLDPDDFSAALETVMGDQEKQKHSYKRIIG